MKGEIIIINWACVFFMFLAMAMILIMKKYIYYVPKKFYNLSFYSLITSTYLYTIKIIFINTDAYFYMVIVYLDWLIVTPILLYILTLIGMYYEHKNKTLILKIILVYLIMVMNFTIANNSFGIINWIAFLISCMLFIVNLWLIWGPLETISSIQGCYEYKLYKLLASFITIIWIGYTVLWGIGPRVLDIINHKLYTYFIIIIPTIYKLGFLYIALNGLKKVNKIKQY